MILRKLAVETCLAVTLLAAFAADGEPRMVRMAVTTFSQSVLPMVVARDKGYFRAEDLDVELILMTASAANMALIGGNVDFIRADPLPSAPSSEARR